ncbi:MAG: MFS transporter [Candidatus Heimdallarchaeota archaeon]|nr:MFS transporter [Candidatus Heimdallarchaeota archaeon]
MTENIEFANESEVKLKLRNEIEYKTEPYRWVVLLLFMFIGAMTQVIWITFGGVTTESATFYGVSNFRILMLSLVFMIVYIPMNFPACWFIDKLGLKWGTGIGVILTGVFGFLRAVTHNYWLVLTFQIMTAVGQPFILNSFTKLAASWFPEKEKTLATGLGTVAMFIGVIVAFLTSPFILGSGPDYRMDLLLYIYGGIALLAMVLYLIFVKDKPVSPPNAYSDKSKVLATEGTFSLFKKRDFTLLFIILFIGLGAFNAISSVLDIIFNYNEGDPQPGLIGGIMVIGGVIGALVISTLSDKLRKRKIFIIIAMVSGAVFTPMLYFITNDIARYIISFVYGFLLVSALPVGLTYAAEITYPVPEETSNGFMMWIGQIGGIILLVAIMLTDKFNASLIFINIAAIIAFFVVGTILSFIMKDLDAHEIKAS